jgi:hypothetical protein
VDFFFMSGDEVEFEFEYETPFVAEMPVTRQHFFYFFTKFSISGVFLSAVFLITRTMTNRRTIWDSMEGGALRRWARRARPSIRLRKSSETVRDRADALGPSWTGVDTRDARTQAGRQCATRSPVSGAEIRNRVYNEHLL